VTFRLGTGKSLTFFTVHGHEMGWFLIGLGYALVDLGLNKGRGVFFNLSDAPSSENIVFIFYFSCDK